MVVYHRRSVKILTAYAPADHKSETKNDGGLRRQARTIEADPEIEELTFVSAGCITFPAVPLACACQQSVPQAGTAAVELT